MAHTNHVRTIRLTPEQIENQRQRARRARMLANQPWHLGGLTLHTAFTTLPEDALAPLQTRFTAQQQKVYDARAAIIERLRKGAKPEALAAEHNINVGFIRWIDGRSRA